MIYNSRYWLMEIGLASFAASNAFATTSVVVICPTFLAGIEL